VTAVMDTGGLGRRYGRRWALRDCTLSVPAGRVVGLVGPNGAGKTTLLHLIVGLLRPSTGWLRVLGEDGAATAGQRPRVGFVAQDKPLYRGFRVGEMLAFGAWTNRQWDSVLVESRLRRLRIPLGQRVGRLSGGQQAQVALALALGKQPELLVLDEPVANLDPLARVEFLRMLMEAVAETGLSVVLSSHLVADLERVCDHLILLTAGDVQLCDDTERLLAEHRMLTGPSDRVGVLPTTVHVVHASGTDRQANLLVRTTAFLPDPAWASRPVTMEELVLAYMSPPAAAPPGRLTAVPEQVPA
jgi:ABC-2 type transport system ATP-binding protein